MGGLGALRALHGGHGDVDLFDARQGHDAVFGLSAELLFHGACGGGEFEGDSDFSLLNDDILHEAQRDDVALEVGDR